jgi:carbamoyl-phosphate synthase large subunit
MSADTRLARLLFLGASKRVSLLEYFYKAAARLGVRIEIYSCEAADQFYPISGLATILPGPKFTSHSFQEWLESTVRRHSIDIIIPNMDAATVALSEFKRKHGEKTCWPVVSESAICWQMFDKLLSEEVFRNLGIPHPPNTPGHFPKIVKPRTGFGAKGISIAPSQAALQPILAGHSDLYQVQDLIEDAVETTVDFYVSRGGKLIGYVLRDRIEVSDGEVMVCRTRPARPEEAELIRAAAGIAKWQGCITLQYLAKAGRLYVLEINPRFGGGATCSIEAGLDMPSYILSEYLERSIDEPDTLKNLFMTRARRDFFYEYA